ncbi:Isochorismatase hydrolase [Setomelanomma holmii]|uniref:Isochorismatase hydrolase n=1 Tax=Setomelanomma holmii TaxID=210430 RepID=A0A9P4LKT2_9PLEO|nr:Isochorismatase hydrolase [Setomelanomma holmii]
MPNLLAISLEGFSASSRQVYPQLFPKILSRTAVHESITIDDALNYIGTGWPNVILVSDPAITSEENKDLLNATIEWIKHGGTVVFMGFFASTVQYDELDKMFKEDFGLKWRVTEYTSHDVRLHHTVDENMLRRASLVREFQAKALFLGHVPSNDIVYAGGPKNMAYAAFTRLGLGKLGYIGDVNFGEEPERLILAMCHLDRPEDSLQAMTLVIIDMQNFFLSEAFGKSKGPGHAACDQLVRNAIPAARKAGIRIIWLNWGLSDQDIKDLPPAVKRAFGFYTSPSGSGAFDEEDGSISLDKHGHPKKDEGAHKGLGTDCGTLDLNGKKIQAGRLLMRDTWNAALYPPLDAMYSEGAQLAHNPDVWIHKDRMSGMWGAKTACEEFLEKEGIRTLLFAGVNTDQCVGGTLTDAFSKGYDCVLLSDGCGTSSPDYAQRAWEFNASNTFGFGTSCEQFVEGVEGMGKEKVEMDM